MTRFNRDLSGRVERDLSQISDRATPSSTAWEAIQHRIDEQDSHPHSERTMEVIMLDPDTNKLNKRPRTGMLVAASVAAIALVGGLVVVANRDDDAPPADRPDPVPTVAVTDPAIAGDAAESVDDSTSVVDPSSSRRRRTSGRRPEVRPRPRRRRPTARSCRRSSRLTCHAGSLIVPTCTNGEAVSDARTTVDRRRTGPATSSASTPNRSRLIQVVELSLLEDVGTPESPAGAFVSLGDNGFMNAGLLWDSGTRGVGSESPKVRTITSGEPIWLSADSMQNADGSLDEIDARWWSTEGPRPAAAEDSELTAEVTVVCEQVPVEGEFVSADQTCTYEGDDPRFVPEPESGRFVLFPADFATTANGSGAVFNDYFTATLGDTTIRAGLVEGFQFVRWVGIRPGTGEFEGLLIQEHGWVETVQGTSGESTATGVIQMTVLPADG